MASADSRQPILTPYGASSTRQTDGSPKVMRATFLLMPVGFTSWRSVQVLGFTDLGLLTPPRRLISASCSSGQHFACGFLQIPPHDGLPCRSANTSPCRVCKGLPPPSRQTRHHSEPDSASHGATRHAWRTKKKARQLPGFLDSRTCKLIQLLPRCPLQPVPDGRAVRPAPSVRCRQRGSQTSGCADSRPDDLRNADPARRTTS
jgi:hypothetical protein